MMTEKRRRQRYQTSPPLSPTTSNSSSSNPVYSSPQRPLQSRSQAPKSKIPNIPRRLLVPKYSQPRPSDSPPVDYVPSAKSRSSLNRLGRSRADSAPPEVSVSFASNLASISNGRNGLANRNKGKERDSSSIQEGRNGIEQWLTSEGCRFELETQDVELTGYQVFAVEKWIVDRSRYSALLTVYTGDARDKVVVSALVPVAVPESDEAQQEWEKALSLLKSDGAKPKETDKGVILITSLASFRSDYAVVQIPGGDFDQYRQRVFVNINLQRLGCSGRSALTLQEPSETTKDKFLSMFSLPSSQTQASMGLRGDPNATFRQTVIEVVRVMQCALYLYDLFSADIVEQNGLLCDTTLDGLQKWLLEIGQQYLKIETSERPADPLVLSSMVSLIYSMRGKLSAIGEQNVPKDPLLHPRKFSRTLAQFVNSRLQSQAHAHHSTTSLVTPFQTRAHTPFSPEADQPPPTALCQHAFLNLTLIRVIDACHDKSRSGDAATRLQRAVKSKIDGITAATSSAISPSRSISGEKHGSGLDSASGLAIGQSLSMGPQGPTGLGLGLAGTEKEALLEPTSDLRVLVSKVEALRGKEYGASIRYLWSGRLEVLERKREDGFWEDVEEEREKEVEKERDGGEKTDSDDDGGVFPWNNRVTRKIESWAGRDLVRKPKKASIDLSAAASLKSPAQSMSQSHSAVPSVKVSRDPDDLASGLSSGQASPISPSPSFYGLSTHSRQASRSALGLSSSIQIINPTPSPSVSPGSASLHVPSQIIHHPPAPPFRRLASWSDALSAGGDEVEIDLQQLIAQFDPFGPARDRDSYERDSSSEEEPSARSAFRARRVRPIEEVLKGGLAGLGVGRREKPPRLLKLKRSSSADDLAFMDIQDTLPLDYLHIDVELCGQSLVAHRRKAHVRNVEAALQAFLQHSSKVNADLLAYHEQRLALLQSVCTQSADAITSVEESDALAHDLDASTEAIEYEMNVLSVGGLWNMARAPRMRVFAIRDRVFGVKSKARGGGALTKSRIGTRDLSLGGAEGHGRFNRPQKTLDGRTRFVDFLGRTESDVDEEEELPEDVPPAHQHRSGEETDEELDQDFSVPESKSTKDNVPDSAQPSFTGWALSMFSKWGNVLGVSGSHPESQPQGSTSQAEHLTPIVPSESAEEKFEDALSDLDDVSNPSKFDRKRISLANGHIHRLSTVGEEDEPASMPSTPTPMASSMSIVSE